ncbi:MAG: hypothetical protein OEV00_06720 [Acidobacteriota bacterium]|nr:hypothetical protein [Acidobacteriota bacterium]MDH3785003.1 hypothetical protein [Acidobacteriota bacterium]
MRRTISQSLIVIVWATVAACVAPTAEPQVVPPRSADLWLTTASDGVGIRCRRAGTLFECNVTTRDGAGSYSGYFAFTGGNEPVAFDPSDPGQYGAWDGHSIYLTNGRVMESMQVVP